MSYGVDAWPPAAAHITWGGGVLAETSGGFLIVAPVYPKDPSR